MHIEFAKKFMLKHKDKIIDLFLRYQMIEMILFAKLYLPNLDESSNRENEITSLNKSLNTKTFSKLRNEYLKKFPDDRYNLATDLLSVGQQRNGFMHSLWIVIALTENKDKAMQLGELLLNDFIKGAEGLLDKSLKIPVTGL